MQKSYSYIMFGEDILDLTDELEIITEGNIVVYYLDVQESNDNLELIETVLKSLGMEYSGGSTFNLNFENGRQLSS